MYDKVIYSQDIESIKQGTKNKEHPEFEFHFTECNFSEDRDGKYVIIKFENKHRRFFMIANTDKDYKRIINPEEIGIHFGSPYGENFLADNFIIASVIPNNKESRGTSYITSPMIERETGNPIHVENLYWELVDFVPKKFYIDAMTLIEADKFIRKYFRGYCLIKSLPTIEAPDETDI